MKHKRNAPVLIVCPMAKENQVPLVFPHYERKHIIASSKEFFKLTGNCNNESVSTNRIEIIRGKFTAIAARYSDFYLSKHQLDCLIHDINISNNWIPDVASASRVNQLFRDFDVPYIIIATCNDKHKKINAKVVKFNWENIQNIELSSFLYKCVMKQICLNEYNDNLITDIIKLYRQMFNPICKTAFFISPDDIKTVPDNLSYSNWDVGAVDAIWVNRVLASIGLNYSIEKNTNGTHPTYRVLGHAQSN